ncbi:MAG: DUF1499 domain-containing protein [Candidatus Tectomicrobia bacterium]|uniref:DUF1499 domain-containing protein n=1 Tax=Tectimicrobiota bacterium TaxID=2528274 RepID=A0A933EAC7_UNCTE|nr:DUF1499 domain-containing protein [Candidatus Tectomicrobia bacterium]
MAATLRQRLSLLSYLGLILALAAGLTLLASGPGHRLGLWHWRTGFLMMAWAGTIGIWAVWVSLAGGLFAVFGAMKGRTAAALAGLALGFLMMSVPGTRQKVLRSVPRIHEVSTDTEKPPHFQAVLALRMGAKAANPPEYNAKFAPLQKKAFPDIQPAYLEGAPQAAFDRALAAAAALGWNIVASDRASGRIEAVATTFWYGFQDDVVIRVQREGERNRVDIRSKSRVGGSDFGTNAKRVRAYLKALGGGKG